MNLDCQLDDQLQCVHCGYRAREMGLRRNCPVLKSWDPTQPSRGLGDSIAKMTHAVGIKRLCGGCKKRQELLNRVVPYSQ